MTTKHDYSPEEWRLLASAPTMVSAGVSASDFGIVSFAKEVAALIRAVREAKARYADNELVLAVIEEFERAEAEGAEAQQPQSLDENLATVARIAQLVGQKAPPEEARSYKTFLYELAEIVAAASGEGLFGFGEKVSEAERTHLGRLKGALAI
jgi:hypothetical protein